MECAGDFNGYQSHESYGIVINVAQIHQEPPEKHVHIPKFHQNDATFFLPKDTKIARLTKFDIHPCSFNFQVCRYEKGINHGYLEDHPS